MANKFSFANLIQSMNVQYPEMYDEKSRITKVNLIELFFTSVADFVTLYIADILKLTKPNGPSLIFDDCWQTESIIRGSNVKWFLGGSSEGNVSCGFFSPLWRNKRINQSISQWTFPVTIIYLTNYDCGYIVYKDCTPKVKYSEIVLSCNVYLF